MQAPFESLGCFSRSFIHLDPIKAEDGTYSAGGGVRLGYESRCHQYPIFVSRATNRQRVRYVLLKNQKDLNAPVVLHFHGTGMDLTVY